MSWGQMKPFKGQILSQVRFGKGQKVSSRSLKVSSQSGEVRHRSKGQFKVLQGQVVSQVKSGKSQKVSSRCIKVM